MPSLHPLATLSPPSNTRAWLSSPHPHLPILATACADRTVRIYSLKDDFSQQSTISGGHKRSIRSVAWKTSGSRKESVLATGSFDASAGIWRRDESSTFSDAGEGSATAVERDFTKGLSGGGAEEDENEDDEEWRFAVVLDGHDSEIKSVAFAPSAPLLATCSRDKSVWIWEELEDDNFETVAVLQEHEGDVKCVAWHPGEELLASASYDDTVRLWREDVDDWACCAVLVGHSGTVWWVEFEDGNNIYALDTAVTGEKEGEVLSKEQQAYVQMRLGAGSRLLSCSDDMSIRVWRRVPKERPDHVHGQLKTPSIWKNRDFEEEWVEEARLPQVHERPVYALSWSKKTGKVVSTGSDGRIVVYEERWRTTPSTAVDGADTVMADGTPAPEDAATVNGSNGSSSSLSSSMTEWIVVAQIENAHDVFEINNVVWAPRADKGKKYEDEEVIVSTGDDGEVKVWTLED